MQTWRCLSPARTSGLVATWLTAVVTRSGVVAATPSRTNASDGSVSVPVLSVQMTVVEPRASTAVSRLIRAWRRAIRRTATASETDIVAGSPSGTSATVTPTLIATAILLPSGAHAASDELTEAHGFQVAHRDSLVIDIAGDASVQMTMQEMSTAVQFDLPIKIFILNNEYMGMVRQWQELLHGGRYSHSYTAALPDFVKLAEAYQGVGIRAEKPSELDDAIREQLRNAGQKKLWASIHIAGSFAFAPIKDSDGIINIAFDHPLAGRQHTYIHDLPKLTHFLHSQGMHAIGRIAIFRDQRLVETHPELAVKSARSGQAWRENGKLVWTDPSNAKVQQYNIALAKYVADSGVDEIQFDYVRFPSDGDLSVIRYPGAHAQPMGWTIPLFLKYARSRLKPLGVRVTRIAMGGINHRNAPAKNSPQHSRATLRADFSSSTLK